MNIHRLLSTGVLGSLLLTSTAFAQNISTDTSSTTVGSTQFGVLLSESNLGTIMQSTVAPSCLGPSDSRICTSLGADGTAGTNDDFVRIDQLPGSFTDSPIAGEVSALPNFACGDVGLAIQCASNFSPFGAAPGDQAQTAPDFTGRQLVGIIDVDISIGDSGVTPGMPEGFMRFTLDPASGAATIDQLIDHSIDLGGGNAMVFQQRDATIGTGNLIPDPIDGPLTLVAFTALDQPSLLNFIPIPEMGMVSRLNLAQGNADGFGGINVDVTVNFPGQDPDPFVLFPLGGAFVTPGLNTGGNPPFGSPFGPEFNGFAFP